MSTQQILLGGGKPPLGSENNPATSAKELSNRRYESATKI